MIIIADGEDKLYSAINVFLQEREEKLRQLAEKYPDDIPNEACNHAFICGISIENSFHPKVGDFNYLFSIGYEDLYVWTYKKDTNSALVSVVNPSVKEEPFWKTSGRIVQLAFSFVEAFESIEDPTEYRWMYYFNPEVSTIDEVVFYNLTEFERISLSNGRIYKATDIARLASIIDLLERDDHAYNALSLVHSAFNLHWCCLTCELSSHPYHDHLATEPKLWNQADGLQNIEMSIVQSCRAVESILGEPPNRKKASSVIRHKDKWKAEIGIDPDEPFEKAGKSYLDFYYELFFNLRNPSAHSYGNIHYDLQRKMAVAAQCFAAIVLREYIYKHELPNEAALEKLRFNHEFLSKVQDDMSTPLTAE